MEPTVRHTKSADGVHIAYCAVGQGQPLVVMPATPFSHVQLEWRLPLLRRWYEQLIAAGNRIIRFDPRGFGLSDRDVSDFSLEAQLRDMDAVVASLGLGRFDLFGCSDHGMVAAAWAARHPESVSNLILWCSWASRASVAGQSATKTLRTLLDQDWAIYTETASRVLLAWSSEELARGLAAFYRECTSPEVLRRFVPALYDWDVAAVLSQIRCPTLVILRRDVPTVPVEVAREMSKQIPDSRLVVLEGRSPLPFAEDGGALVRAIQEFISGEEPESVILPSVPAADAPVTILFTDIEGSTVLTQRLGDARAQEVVHVHNRIVRSTLPAHGGSEVKHTGDGLMVSFGSATRAVECAIAIQRGVCAQRERHPELPLRVRVGLNAGEPLAESGDYFGTAVQLAARICEQAQPDSIFVSSVVRDLAAGKGLVFSDAGEAVLRGFSEAVRLYEVSWRPS